MGRPWHVTALLALQCLATALCCSVIRRENDRSVSLPCNRMRLLDIHIRLPGNVRADEVTKILLNGNLLTKVDEYAFDKFSNLDVLEFQNNKIESVAPTAFAGTRLTKLDLSNNLLTTVQSDALRYLPHLIELELAFNMITEIGESAFQHNANLEKIDLEGNSLRYFSPHALSPLKAASVRYSPMIVNLASNNLTFIEPALEKAAAFSEIKFKIIDNPWHCDCSLSFLFFKLKLRNDETSANEWPTCRSPEILQEKSWEQLTRMDFACAPRIHSINAGSNEPSRDAESDEQKKRNHSVVQVLEGSDLQLVCRGYVDPPQDVSWRKDGLPMSIRDRRVQRVPSLTQVVQFTENLTLFTLSLNDSGVYSCNVSNVAGTSEVNVTVVVLERPATTMRIDIDDGDFLPSQGVPARRDWTSSTLHYVLLASATVGGLVLVMSVAAIAYYCVKNRYLSYNSVVYRVRKQEQEKADCRKAPTDGTSHNHSNYLNLSNGLNGDCAAGLLLARPVLEPVQPSPRAQSPETFYTTVGSSFSQETRRKLDSPLTNGTLTRSDMLTIKRAYPPGLLASPCRQTCNNNDLRCLHAEFDTLCDNQHGDSGCSCSMNAGSRCKVYFAAPYSDSPMHSTACTLQFARVPQDSQVCNNNFPVRFCPEDLLGRASRSALALPQNNLASAELDDKSPTLSNSTNSTAMFVNRNADIDNV